jgi:Bacterial sugar transferase/CoA-binding domain
MHRSRDLRILRIAVACLDAAIISIVFTSVFVLYPTLHADQGPLASDMRRALQVGIYVVGWVVLFAAYRLYEPEYILDGAQQYGRLMQASTTGLLLLVGVVALVDGSMVLARSWLLGSWLLSLLALGLSRFLIRRLVWRLRRRGLFTARTLIVGAGEDGLAIADQISSYAPGVARVVGFLDEYRPIGTEVGTSKVLGEPLALATFARQTGATEAIIVPQEVTWESMQALMQAGAESWGLQRLWLAPAFRDLLTTGMEVQQRGTLPLLAVSGPRITGLEAAIKRGLDLALVIAASPVALSLGALIALWLVAARRVRPIRAREAIGRNRRLPALLNVLRGDMSLVGPRPIDCLHDSQYTPWRVMLTSVRPGLTGPWWLRSGSNRLSVQAEVAADLAYIRTYSIWSDTRLFWLTAQRLVSTLGSRPTEAGSVEPNPETIAQQATAATSGGTR